MKRRISIIRRRTETDAKRFIQTVIGDSPSLSVMVFRIGRESYSIALRNIVQVLRVNQTSFISDISLIKYVHGYISFRKLIIPVINTHTLFKIPEIKEANKRTSILICENNNNLFGFLTDEVLEVIPVEATEIVPIPNKLIKYHKDIFTKCHSWRDNIVILLELSGIINSKDISIIKDESSKLREQLSRT